MTRTVNVFVYATATNEWSRYYFLAGKFHSKERAIEYCKEQLEGKEIVIDTDTQGVFRKGAIVVSGANSPMGFTYFNITTEQIQDSIFERGKFEVLDICGLRFYRQPVEDKADA